MNVNKESIPIIVPNATFYNDVNEFTRNLDKDNQSLEFSCGGSVDSFCSTKVRVPKYTKHLVDYEYICEFNKLLNGKITYWRCAVSRIISKFLKLNSKYNLVNKEQLYFVQTKVAKMQLGISKCTRFSIEILNEESIKLYIEGVNSKELAEFLMLFADCKTVKVEIQINREHCDFQVVTIFETSNGSTVKKVFGKKHGW